MTTRKASGAGRHIWIDGLRGVAACVVAIFHYTVVDLPVLSRSYWDEPVLDNQRWYQLPPFRILWAGPAMVRLLFVISGYALSTGIDDSHADEREDPKFYRRLTSAVFRRIFRLYIPLFVVSIACHVVFYLGLYSWNPVEKSCTGATPFSAPWPHIRCLVVYLLDSLNVVDMKWNEGLNNTLWSIPFEYQASLAVFLVLLALRPVRPIWRLTIIGGLGAFYLWFGTPNAGLTSFFAGMFLSEMRKWRKARDPVSLDVESGEKLDQRSQSRTAVVAPAMALISGIWLLSLPGREYDDARGLPPDYWFANWISPPSWADPMEFGFCCYAIGAVLVLGSLHDLPLLRSFLETTPIQHLGRMAFSIFLIHSAIFQIARDKLMILFCWLLGGHDYHAILGHGEAGSVLVTAHVGTAAAVAAIVLLISDRMSTLVDQKSKSWAIQIEAFVCGR